MRAALALLSLFLVACAEHRTSYTGADGSTLDTKLRAVWSTAEFANLKSDRTVGPDGMTAKVNAEDVKTDPETEAFIRITEAVASVFGSQQAALNNAIERDEVDLEPILSRLDELSESVDLLRNERGDRDDGG